MKTSLKTTAILFGILFVGITFSSFKSENNKNRNAKTDEKCVSEISHLSTDQKMAIEALETNYHQEMDELRAERRSTNNEIAKSDIRLKMVQKKTAHEYEVKGLLTNKQQKEYEAIHADSGKKLNQKGKKSGNKGRGNGNGNGKASNKGQKGQGNGANCSNN